MDSTQFVSLFSNGVYLLLFIALICAGIAVAYFLLTGRRLRF